MRGGLRVQGGRAAAHVSRTRYGQFCSQPLALRAQQGAGWAAHMRGGPAAAGAGAGAAGAALSWRMPAAAAA